MALFATADPRVSGLSARVGTTVLYVNVGTATLLFKYGAGDTEWSTLPFLGGAEPVTADPRSAGLARPVGSRALYVSGGAGVVLLKYGAGNTEWCTWEPAVAAHLHAQGDVTGLGAALAAKSDSGHGHADMSVGVAGFAPAGTGNPDHFLRSDGIYDKPAGGSGGGVTAATLTLGATAKREHRITVVDAAVSGSSKIIIGWGNPLDTDANGPDMDNVRFAARAGAGSFVAIVASDHPLNGDLKIHYQVG